MDLPNETVIDLSTVVFDSMELIIVQTRINDDFTQSFYRVNGSAFNKVYHIEALNRTTIPSAPFIIDGHDCIIIHNYYDSTSFDILCVNVSQEMLPDLQMMKFDTQQVGAMKQLIPGNGNILVVLGNNDVLIIIDYIMAQKKITTRTIRNVTSIAARTFDQWVFIAVSTTTTDRSKNTIEIYRQVLQYTIRIY